MCLMQLCKLSYTYCTYWAAREAVMHIFLMVEMCVYKCPLDVHSLQKTRHVRCLETLGTSYPVKRR
jgi:hypothetical protein